MRTSCRASTGTCVLIAASHTADSAARALKYRVHDKPQRHPHTQRHSVHPISTSGRTVSW